MIDNRLKFIADRGYRVDRYVGLSQLLNLNQKRDSKIPINKYPLYMGFMDDWSISNDKNSLQKGSISIHFQPENIIRIKLISINTERFAGNFANLGCTFYGRDEKDTVTATLPADKYIAEVDEEGTPILTQDTKAVLFLQKPSS